MPRRLLSRLLLTAAAPALLLGLCSLGRSAATASVEVTVTEPDGGLLPCRLTLLDAAGQPAPMDPGPGAHLAYRPGVLYTGTGKASFNLKPGRYTLYATRGLEYGLGKRELRVGEEPVQVRMRLEREVDTSGYICADTHIHTLTFSGHGDASLNERLATIAGEGIELAVATDHNHHTDYRPAMPVTGTTDAFTPVIGNEVTTKIGHFNTFPVAPGATPPNPELPDWASLLKAMRAVPGVRVVTLNHPADNHNNFIPTSPKRFHPASGESRDGSPWTFDGFEVVTSAALHSDLMRPYRDWFALLNRGLRISGMGSSDTHDVNRFILGQGRTYIASQARKASDINVGEACDSILAGRVLASMGLFTELWVDGSPVGGFARGTGPMQVRVRVQGPRWIEADRLDLYANGQKILSRPLISPKGQVVKTDLTLELKRPAQDAWLVVVATGPGISEPYWPIPRPYQPDRAEWDPRVLGSTNPVRVDGDGDGRYTSPYDYARRLVDACGGDAVRLVASLEPYDTAVAVQAASLCRERGIDLSTGPARRAIDGAPGAIRHGFVAYAALLN